MLKTQIVDNDSKFQDTTKYKKIICYFDNETEIPENKTISITKQYKKQKEKKICECGGVYDTYSLKKHLTTKKHIKFINKDVETKRVCKMCKNELLLNLENFQDCSTKNSKNISYRHTCKKCFVIKKQPYMKKYHKTNYKSTKLDDNDIKLNKKYNFFMLDYDKTGIVYLVDSGNNLKELKKRVIENADKDRTDNCLILSTVDKKNRKLKLKKYFLLPSDNEYNKTDKTIIYYNKQLSKLNEDSFDCVNLKVDTIRKLILLNL